MTYDPVFVVEPEIWAGVISTGDKSVHLVLVQINKADIAVEVVVINIVCTHFAI